MRYFLLFLLFGSLFFHSSHAQSLERRPFIGIRLAPIADSLRSDQAIPATGGIFVQHVFPNSSASAAGIFAGDIVCEMEGKSFEGPAAFLSLLRTYKVGDQIRLTLIRDGKKKNLPLTLLPFPSEQYENATIYYGSVRGNSGPLRTILSLPTKPISDPPPVVFFIQGIDCGSVDVPFSPQGPYAQLVRKLSEEGYASFRLEKSGVGDSQGKACRDCDFKEDYMGFLEGLRSLKSQAEIDKDRVYLFGLSMGGVWGPLLAKEEQVAGLAVYGTIGRPWMEYMLENSRRQAFLGGEDPGTVETQLKQDAQIYHHWLGLKKSPSKIIQEFPMYASRLKMWSTRPDEQPLQHMHADRLYSFQSQLQAINISETWQSLDTHVLVMWGKGDYVSNQADHQLITHIVNGQHPGQATYVEVDADHFFNTASSEREAYDNMRSGNPGEMNTAIFDTLIHWIEQVDG